MAPDRYDWLWQHTFEVDQQGALKGDYVQQDAGTKICARIIEQTIPVHEYMAVSHYPSKSVSTSRSSKTIL